jgi:uncharacterized protein YecT (DUF1311 family)
MLTTFSRAAIVLLLTSMAWPQSGDSKKPAEPPDPCDKATTQMEITDCQREQANKADGQLTLLYQKVEKAIQVKMAAEDGYMKGYRQRALEKLKAAQLAWNHYREAQCAAEEQQNEGGTIAPAIHAVCMRELAGRRMDELQKTYAIYLK